MGGANAGFFDYWRIMKTCASAAQFLLLWVSPRTAHPHRGLAKRPGLGRNRFWALCIHPAGSIGSAAPSPISRLFCTIARPAIS
jgi:hypothetical protein